MASRSALMVGGLERNGMLSLCTSQKPPADRALGRSQDSWWSQRAFTAATMVLICEALDSSNFTPSLAETRLNSARADWSCNF